MSAADICYSLPRKIALAQLACSDAATLAHTDPRYRGEALLIGAALVLLTIAEDAPAAQDVDGSNLPQLIANALAR